MNGEKLDDAKQIAQIVAVAVPAITAAVKLGAEITRIIQESGLSEDKKEVYIARIREAQAAIPVWNEGPDPA